jgi:nucleotide-binding universal stress UspA family protein
MKLFPRNSITPATDIEEAIMSAKPIIVPTDFSEHSAIALGWARRMSALLDTPIHCVYVMSEASVYSGMEFIPAAYPSMEEIREGAEAELVRFIAKHDLGSEPTGVVLTGAPFVEIIRYARAQDAAMIIMSTHGYGGLKHVLLGSTTAAVVRKAACPVLSIPALDGEFEMP